ncbi:MAG: isopentenyl-diphosphate Delta-isomerase [Gemmatimonadetes bacterium]|nr:isopentenyl-diphosphate Delta-isomerase [Gemmatimonadota bacterium]
MRLREERVVLVDDQDHELGTGEKLAVHRAGRLHRAFSVFVLDGEGRLVLQRRAAGKYHSAGLWSNTCCGHPRPGEPTPAAARRRLREEMGFECPLSAAFSFVYRAELEDGLTEHELDHVFVGSFRGTPRPDPAEVAEWRAVPVDELTRDLAARPRAYSAWLPPALDGLVARGLLNAAG